MSASLDIRPVRAQAAIDQAPLDKWVTPFGGVAAQFYRTQGGFLVRFPDQADFELGLPQMDVVAHPACEDAPVTTLFQNAILPLIGNYQGELHLHGSAVSTPWGACAFMGLSRRGKTTLAGAFAKAGYPFLTEDAVSLRLGDDGTYMVQPQRPVLRLFGDSAEHLLGSQAGNADAKSEFAAGDSLPFASEEAPLRALFLLGPGESEDIAITPMAPALALTEMMQNAFILDVEDKQRLRAHFTRISALAETVPCRALDYPRRYDQLPLVLEQVCQIMRAGVPSKCS